MTFNKKAGNLVKQAQNILKRKESAQTFARKSGILATHTATTLILDTYMADGFLVTTSVT